MNSPVSTCKELVTDPNLVNNVDLMRYERLHQKGKKLIKSWYRRALVEWDCHPEQSFEPFIYLWISFNAWADCVTEFDYDKKWIQALSIFPEIANTFLELRDDPKSSLSQVSNQFYDLWPIFKAQEIRRNDSQYYGKGTRKEIIEFYFQHKIQYFEPKCWKKHIESGEVLPLDWPHTLATLYRVRCNLFHGEKAVHSEMDRRIVHAAFRVLLYFFNETGYIDHNVGFFR